jgi:hypothetical protein
VQAAALASEQTTFDRFPREVVVEGEHVGVRLDDDPAVDGARRCSMRTSRPPGPYGGQRRRRRAGRAPTSPTRRRAPRVEAVDLAAHGLGDRPGSGAWRSSSLVMSPAPATSSSRKNGLPPVRAVQRLDGSVRRLLLEHRGEELVDLRRAEPVELHVGDEWRRSRRGRRSAAGWRRDSPSGRYVPTSTSGRGRARRAARGPSRLSASAQWRSSNDDEAGTAVGQASHRSRRAGTAPRRTVRIASTTSAASGAC